MRASRRSGTGRENLRILAGLATAGVLMGAAVTLALRTAGEWADPGDAHPAGPAPAAHAPATPAAKPAPKGAVKPAAPAPAVDARAAAAMSPLRPVPRQAAQPQPLAHLDEGLTYQYNALGRRDPFAPLMGGAVVGDDVGGDAPPDIGGIKVVGIVWGSEDRFALCEDARGNSLVLRTGDKVMNGFVEGLKRDKLIVNLTTDGQSQSVAIPLTRKGDNSNANR